MNAPGSNGITLVVGRYCYCNLVVVVVVSPLGRSGPVKLLPCQLLVYRIRWKNEGREGDGIVHFAGIVGTRLTLRGAHMVLPWSDRVLALVCFVCGCIKRRHVWEFRGLALLCSFHHCVTLSNIHKLVNAVK